MKSTESQKFSYCLTVTMSPPPTDSPPPSAQTCKVPSIIFHPISGKVSAFALFQPSVVFPSKRRTQPSAAIFSESTFGSGQGSKNSSSAAGALPQQPERAMQMIAESEAMPIFLIFMMQWFLQDIILLPSLARRHACQEGVCERIVDDLPACTVEPECGVETLGDDTEIHHLAHHAGLFKR